MSSKQAEEMGLTRKGDGYEAPPDHFTVLSVDIDPAVLLAKYDGKPTEQAIIRGIMQERRSRPDKIAPASFVRRCMGGIVEPIQFVRLKPDNDNKVWLVVDKGNNRTIALRKVNKIRETRGDAPLQIEAKQSKRVGSGKEAGAFAAERHSLSNVRVKVRPSENAETAAKLAAQTMSTLDIVTYLDNVETEAEVLELLALAECIEAVKDAIDAGEVPVKAALRLAKMSEAKQAEWLAAKSAPKPERPKANGHARPLSPAKIARLEPELADCPVLLEVLFLLSGKRLPKDIKDPGLRAAWLRAFGEAAS